MKIIAHRGASGLLLENTLEALRLAVDLGVDGVEFDVQVSKDGVPVLCHDPFLSRISNSKKSVADLTYAQLQKVKLINGSRIPKLEEALEIVKNLSVIVMEIKPTGHTEEICQVLDKFPQANVYIGSFHEEVVADAEELRPDVPRLFINNQNPFMAARVATRHGAGLDLIHGLLNFITYWQLMRAKQPLMIYAPDTYVEHWFVKTFYPKVWFCTNHPERFVRRRRLITSR